MGVAVGDVDAFVPYPLGDCHRAVSQMDEQGHMGVAQVVNPDAFDAALRRPSLHFPAEKTFGHGKGPVGGPQVIYHGKIVLDLLAEKGRHGDGAYALFGLGRCDAVLPFAAVVGFGNVDLLLFEVEILPGQRQQLPLPDAAPVEHLKAVVGDRLIHHGLGKAAVFLFRPDAHLAALLLTDSAGHPGRILRQLVEAHGMIEDGAKLIVKGFQIGLGIGLSIGQFLLHHLILPADDLYGGDVSQTHISEKGDQLGVDDGGLGLPGAVLQAATQILLVDLAEVGKAHVQAGVQTQAEALLPFHGFPFQCEAAPHQIFCFSSPVLVPSLHIPGVVLLVLVDRHGAPPYAVTPP